MARRFFLPRVVRPYRSVPFSNFIIPQFYGAVLLLAVHPNYCLRPLTTPHSYASCYQRSALTLAVSRFLHRSLSSGILGYMVNNIGTVQTDCKHCSLFFPFPSPYGMALASASLAIHAILPFLSAPGQQLPVFLSRLSTTLGAHCL